MDELRVLMVASNMNLTSEVACFCFPGWECKFYVLSFALDHLRACTVMSEERYVC